VAEAMASDPVTVAPDAPIHEVARLLCTRHHHRVLVTEDGDLKGLISTIDVIRLVAEGRLHE
jgi:CBS domain-containing protein